MSARSTSSVPHQAQHPDEVERHVARTADLVLKLAALAERYEAGAGSAERVAAMQEAVRRGRRQLASLGGGAQEAQAAEPRRLTGPGSRSAAGLSSSS